MKKLALVIGLVLLSVIGYGQEVKYKIDCISSEKDTEIFLQMADYIIENINDKNINKKYATYSKSKTPKRYYSHTKQFLLKDFQKTINEYIKISKFNNDVNIKKLKNFDFIIPQYCISDAEKIYQIEFWFF